MPSTPYDLVRDEQDLRIPLHAEQAFFHGITFQAKVSAHQTIIFQTSSFVSLATAMTSTLPPAIAPPPNEIDGLQFNQWLIL